MRVRVERVYITSEQMTEVIEAAQQARAKRALQHPVGCPSFMNPGGSCKCGTNRLIAALDDLERS